MSDTYVHRGRATRWLLFLVAVEVLYILSDFGFNSALLNASGGLVSDPDAIEKIEHVGRLIAGAGFGLALFGLFGSMKKDIASFGSHFKILVLSLAIGVPGMYYGQKALVDYIVDNSSVEARHQAQFLVLAKQGLQEGVVEIEGAPYSPNQASSPEELTFLSVIGALLMNSQAFTDTLVSQKETIVRRLAQQQGHGHIDAHYKRYQEARASLRKTWDTYKASSNDFFERKSDIPVEVDQSWVDIQNDLRKGWQDYDKGVTDYIRQSQDLANRFKSDISRAMTRFRNCNGRRSCQSRVLDGYEQQAGKVLSNVPLLSAWCENVEVSKTDRVLRGVFSMGLSELAGNAGTDRYCPGSTKHMTAVVMKSNEDAFKRESGGYPPTIASPVHFEQHSATISNMRRKLSQKGINLPASWKGDASTYKQAARQHAERALESKWKDEVRKAINHELPPGMSYERFMQSNLVQNRLKREMGDFYVSGMSLDWNKRTFKERVVDPYIEREINQRIREMNAQVKEFADGGSLEESGKDYLRALIVPPIALSLSLFFSLLALAKLPLRIFDLVSIMKTRHVGKKYKLVLLAIMITLITLLPGTIWKNKFSEAPAFAYAMETIKEHQPAPFSFAMNWLIRTEPVVYPLGQEVLNRLGLDNRE